MQSPGPALTTRVRVITHDSPGPTEAALVFGVGQRDEPAHLAGISHLSEHLVMTLMGRLSLFVNAEAGGSTVAFTVTGTADDAVEFLGLVASAITSIADLTEQQLELERRIIEAEDPLRYHDPSPSASTIRFGRRGFGLLGSGTPTVASITRREVVEWVETWFTADNAVVTLSGAELPTSVDVILPAGGRRPEHRRDAPLAETPVLAPLPHPGVVASFLVDVGIVAALDHALPQHLMQVLRLEQGLCYSVESRVARIDADRFCLDLVLDPTPDRVGDLIVALVETLQHLVVTGFSADAVDRVHRSARMTRSSPEAIADASLSARVEELLLGYPARDVEQELEDALAVDSTRLREAMADAVPTLIVSFDQDADIGDTVTNTGIRFDPGEPIEALDEQEFRRSARRHRRWRERGLPGLAGSSAIVTDEGLLLGGMAGGFRVDIANAAVVLHVPDEVVTILSPDGRLAQLRVAEWRGGRSLVEAVVEAADPRLVRLLPPEPRRPLGRETQGSASAHRSDLTR